MGVLLGFLGLSQVPQGLQDFPRHTQASRSAPGPAERSRGSLLLRGSLQFGAAVCPVASELSVFGVVTVTCCPGGGRLPCSPQAELHAGRRSRGRSFPENGGRGTEKDLNPSRNRIKTRNLGLI